MTARRVPAAPAACAGCPSAPPPGAALTSSRARRAELEDAFGAHVQVLIARSGSTPTQVADALGIDRPKLYECFDPIKGRHFRAAWLAALPPAVEALYLEERAAALGMQLVAVADETTPRALGDVMRELGDVLAQTARAEADGFISPEEAEEGLREIDDAMRVLAARRALLREAVQKRGLAVVGRGGK